MTRTLILPFSITEADTRESEAFLSRQLPIYFRNHFEKTKPGEVKALPLATGESDDRHWVLTTDPVTVETGLALGKRQKSERVLLGTLAGPPGDRVPETRATRILHLRLLEVETGALLLDRVFSGDLIRVTRAALQALVALDAESKEEVFAFRPGTHSVPAFEAYLEGLDVLLALRTEGIQVGAPDALFCPYDRALEADPCFDAAMTAGLTCAMLFVDAGHRELPLEAALTVLDRWSRLFVEERKVFAVWSELLVRSQRFADALDVIEAALFGAHPEDSEFKKRRGELLLQLGHAKEALEVLEDCLKTRCEAVLHERCAEAARQSDDPERARFHLRHLIEADRDDATRWAKLAELERGLGRPDAMWTAFTAMFESSLAPPQAVLAQMISALEEFEAPEDAREIWRRWYPPRDFGARRRLLWSRVLRLAGARFEAGLCLRSVKGAPLDEDLELAQARERLNLRDLDFEESFEEIATRLSAEGQADSDDGRFLLETLDREPNFWPARFLLSIWRQRRGDEGSAVRELERVLAIRPRNDLAWYSHGLQLMRMGRFRDALASLERSVALNDAEGEYYCQLALCRFKLRDLAAAQKALDQAQSLRPDHPDDARVATMIRESAWVSDPK